MHVKYSFSTLCWSWYWETKLHRRQQQHSGNNIGLRNQQANSKQLEIRPALSADPQQSKVSEGEH